MTLPVPKFAIGDKAYWAGALRSTELLPCPDCHDTHKWKATSPSGIECECQCPRCGSGYGARPKDLTLLIFRPEVSLISIGSVRIDTAARDDAVTYMTSATGSGQVYGESRLFATEPEAVAHAKLYAAQRTAQTPHCTESAEHVREFALYSFTNAKIEESKKAQMHLGVDVSMFVDNVRDAVECAVDLNGLKDDITHTIEKWEQR